MEYTMALTRRHLFPTEAAEVIFPSRNEDHNREGESIEHRNARLAAWADFTIPADCTKLRVYMSGYSVLRSSLRSICEKRGISCVVLYPTTKVKKKYKKKGLEIPREVAMNTTAYKEEVLV